MDKKSTIYLSGHTGLVGSNIMKKLERMGYGNLILKTRGELDLLRQTDVERFFNKERPEYVILAAARVGGIWANDNYPAEFIYQNLMIQTNVIHAAYLSGVKKLLFLGSSCIYPKFAPQPIKEEYLLDGKLEKTNEPYAIAKISGIKMCQAYNRQYGTHFISIMPTNLYGPNDNFDLETSHAMAALIAKLHKAKIEGMPETVLWGTGQSRREFLYVEDMADACLFLMNNYEGSEPVNAGVGKDISLMELSQKIKEVVGYEGRIVFDHIHPDGTPQKLLDITRITKMGWAAKTSLREGIRLTYEWYLNNIC
ncbi:GDP-L-fucose synthase [bacterium]|nr:GDP-L-fucose synthase [bacterium]